MKYVTAKVEKSTLVTEHFNVTRDIKKLKPATREEERRNKRGFTVEGHVEDNAKLIHSVQFSTHTGVALNNVDLQFLMLLMEHLKKEGYKLEP